MPQDENKGSRRRNGKSRSRKRKNLASEEIDESRLKGFRKIWEKGLKQSLLTILFASSVVFICFVGQDPPGLRVHWAKLLLKTYTQIDLLIM